MTLPHRPTPAYSSILQIIHVDLILPLYNFNMYSQFQLHTHIGWKLFPILECICSCFSIYSSILYQGQHIYGCIFIRIQSVGRLGNALQFSGTSATLGWNQRFKVPSSVRFNDFHKMLHRSL